MFGRSAGQQVRSPCLGVCIFPEKPEYQLLLRKRMRKERGLKRQVDLRRGMWEITIAEWENKQLGEHKRTGRQNLGPN